MLDFFEDADRIASTHAAILAIADHPEPWPGVLEAHTDKLPTGRSTDFYLGVIAGIGLGQRNMDRGPLGQLELLEYAWFCANQYKLAHEQEGA